MGAKWRPNGIAVMGQMGIHVQRLDVIYPCCEGWEGPELASSHHYACLQVLARPPLLEELSFRGKSTHPRPKEVLQARNICQNNPVIRPAQVSLSTDDPMQFHKTEEPVLEEHSGGPR